MMLHSIRSVIEVKFGFDIFHLVSSNRNKIHSISSAFSDDLDSLISLSFLFESFVPCRSFDLPSFLVSWLFFFPLNLHFFFLPALHRYVLDRWLTAAAGLIKIPIAILLPLSYTISSLTIHTHRSGKLWSTHTQDIRTKSAGSFRRMILAGPGLHYHQFCLLEQTGDGLRARASVAIGASILDQQTVFIVVRVFLLDIRNSGYRTDLHQNPFSLESTYKRLTVSSGKHSGSGSARTTRHPEQNQLRTALPQNS